MISLVLSAQFPLGQFQAHDEAGHPEWPPSPARVLAALLATAYATGRGVEEVRALYALEPPVMHVPPAGRRDISWRRWVPVNPGVKGRGPRMTLERQGKLERAAERGMMVEPSATVRWIFAVEPGAISTEAIGVLREVALAVPYLGRPTSPVAMASAVMEDDEVPEPEAGSSVWVPSETGPSAVSVGSPDRLRALDAREVEREGRPTGHHPKMVERPIARYRERGAVPDGVTMSRAAFADLMEGTAFYSAPPSPVRDAMKARDAPIVLDQLLAALGSGIRGEPPWALPVVVEAGTEAIPVLRGVLVHGCAVAAAVTVAVPQGVVELRFAESGTSLPARSTLRSAVARSDTWVSTVPVRGGEDLESRVRGAADSAGARPLRAEAQGDDPESPSTDPHARCRVLLQLDREVSGPVVMDGIAMTPLIEGESPVRPGTGRTRYPARRDLGR